MSVSFAQASQLAIDAWADSEMSAFGPLEVPDGRENADYFRLLWNIPGHEAGIEGAPSVFVKKATGEVIFIWPADPAQRPQYREMLNGMTRLVSAV